MSFFNNSGADIHILHNQIGRAIVNEARAKIRIWENWTELGHELAFSVFLEDYVLMRLDNDKTLVELRSTVLIAHKLLEFRELAWWNVNHLVFAYVACDIGVLTFVVNWSCSGWLLWSSAAFNRHWVKVLLVTILADVTDVPLICNWCLRCSRCRVLFWCR